MNTESADNSRLKTNARCVFCGQDIAKAGMTRHLTACKARKSRNTEVPAKGKPTRIFYLSISCEYAPIYWMHVEMPASAQLRKLDQFLRDTWLECCGHLSQFKINGEEYVLDAGLQSMGYADKGMKYALSKVLQPGITFQHEYDFGSTTELVLKVVAEREGYPLDKDIFIMARNHPPEVICEICKAKPAVLIDSLMPYDAPMLYCQECGEKALKKHEIYFLPFVNSPRTGVCGYTGDADPEWGAGLDI